MKMRSAVAEVAKSIQVSSPSRCRHHYRRREHDDGHGGVLIVFIIRVVAVLWRRSLDRSREFKQQAMMVMEEEDEFDVTSRD